MRNLKKVVDLNEQQNEAIRQEREALQKERDQYEITKEQLDTVLGELIDRIDQHFVVSGLNFQWDLNGNGVKWGDDDRFLEQCVDALDPSLKYLENKLRTALRDRYPTRPGHPDNDFIEMISQREQCSYVVGVFMGVKMAGASSEKMNALRQLVIQLGLI
jgi:hypothetical protein